MVLQLLLLLLPQLAYPQAVGSGISKHTWASSDPRACYHWLKRYLPVREEYGSCDEGACECATQGRLALAGYTGAPRAPGDPRHAPWGFGLHTVNCSFHPHGELSLADVEAIFQEKFGLWDHLDGFMDYSLGLWSHDLGPLAQELREQGERHLILSWQADGTEYYSLLFSPCGFLVFELISDRLEGDGFTVLPQPHPRMVWREWNDQYIAEAPYLTPIKVSRAVSSLSLVAPYYIDILGGSLVHHQDFGDGTRLMVVNAPKSSVHLQFWEGVPTTGWQAGDLEIYINSVHDEFMLSPVCGFDQWVDNHIAIDAAPGEDGTGPTLDQLLPLLDEGGYHYHIWGGATGNDSTGYDKLITVYGADPFGWGVQFDYPMMSPPAEMPFYTTTCKSNDGCSGQGFCDKL